MAQNDLSATKGCHCLAARRQARAITRLYEAKLRPHGLRATQFSILAALALKGVTPIVELADLLGLERTSLTRSAALLERNGWIEPQRSEDARVRLLRITEVGREKLEEAFPAWQEAQRLAEEGGFRSPPLSADRGVPQHLGPIRGTDRVSR